MQLADLLLEAKSDLRTFYHGSKVEISKFDFKHISPDGNRQLEGPGIYFTTSKEDASRYGGFLHEVTIDMSKGEIVPFKKKFSPMDVQRLVKKAPNLEDVLYEWDEYPGPALNKLVKSIYDRWSPNKYFDMVTQVWAECYRDENEAWLDEMVKMGYIGYIAQRTDAEHFILYNLDAITSIKTVDLDADKE